MVGPSVYVGFLVRGALWWVWLSFIPLIGRATSGGVFWDVCELSMTLGSLSADGWVCVPVLMAVWCEVSSTVACRQSWCPDGYLWVCTCRLIHPGPRNSQVVPLPALGAPTLESQGLPLSGEPRARKPRCKAGEKRKKGKEKRKRKQTYKTQGK